MEFQPTARLTTNIGILSCLKINMSSCDCCLLHWKLDNIKHQPKYNVYQSQIQVLANFHFPPCPTIVSYTCPSVHTTDICGIDMGQLRHGLIARTTCIPGLRYSSINLRQHPVDAKAVLYEQEWSASGETVIVGQRRIATCKP